MANTARTPIMAGNWKMNLDHLQGTYLVQKLDWILRDAKHAYDKVEVAVLPPHTAIRSVQTLVDGDKLSLRYGAQNLSEHDDGAYTGQVSGSMLAKLGCTYVVIGHSERRQYQAETDQIVNKKIFAAIRHGLTPILCCGEDLQLRELGKQLEHITGQIEKDLQSVPADFVAQMVIAYEPIWAIGTGKVATPEDAQEACSAIRAHIASLYSQEVADRVRVLYGGSVKSSNVAAIMAMPDVDGALVGGASLEAAEFAAICRYQDHLTG